MTRTTPRVENGNLYLFHQDGTTHITIPLGSEQWYAWLEAHREFRVKSGTITYTARKKRRAEQWCWYAYRRSTGKVRIAYLGKSEEMTAERLHSATRIFVPSSSPSTRRRARSHASLSLLWEEGQESSAEGLRFEGRGNLPVQLTSFVGRAHEIKEATRLLTQSRLLTLTGTGGIGKTRLALQVAQSCAVCYPGGLWFVELAGITDGKVLLPALATTLGIQPRTEQDLLTAIQVAFQRAPVLLILDNCEHLIAECALCVEQLLKTCPTLHVLSTSREMLCVPGETVLLIAALTFPGAQEGLTLSQASQTEAVQLFLERIKAIQPAFQLTEANMPALVRVCQQLEGIPLALELAAARLSLMPVEQLAERLEQELGARFHLLTSGKRTAAARHQTLRATIDWSYQLLACSEQRLLRRLSVFQGGWTLEAAEMVCAENGLAKVEILDLLGRLVQKSLVLVSEEVLPARSGEQTTTQRRARYRLLETIREYAWEKLQEEDEASAVRSRHLAYFLRLAQTADAHVRGPQQRYWLTCLDVERDNLQVALHTARRAEAPTALALTAALAVYWIVRARFIEGRRELEETLALTEACVDQTRADCLCRAGLLFFFLGDTQRSLQLAEESLAYFQTAGDQRGIGQALFIQLETARQMNLYQRAQELGQQCVDMLKASGDDWTLAITYFSLATIHMHQGNGPQALSLLQESQRLMQRQGDRWGMAMVCSMLGKLTGHFGNMEQALAYFEEATRLAREIGDPTMIVQGQHAQAILLAHRLDYEGAQQRLAEVRRGYEQCGNLSGLAEALFDQGWLASHQRDLTRARLCFERSGKLYAAQGNQHRVVLVRYHLGRVAVMQRDLPRALTLLRESCAIFYQNKQYMFLVHCLGYLARLSLHLHVPVQGARWLGQAEVVYPPSIQQRASLPMQKAFYEETVAGLQTELGEERFATEFAQGREMSLEQAMGEIQKISLPAEHAPGANSPAKPAPQALHYELTTREIEVLRLLATGMRNSEIAERLSISSGTVRAHLSSIYGKLMVHSRTAAVHAARVARVIE